ncbi:uncharacterized protein LOC128551241 [Mercenaria mercenaria]|uniref:uncharacterized protein LOC128551241 n=1 Tax=Mercenaria mercenaria TaxID=6596 RepID=UPI00234F9CB1|nr:uncharacterized protein LOC128551241 [Mercenaria mercenaria]
MFYTERKNGQNSCSTRHVDTLIMSLFIALLVIYAVVTTIFLVRKRQNGKQRQDVTLRLRDAVEYNHETAAYRIMEDSGHVYAEPTEDHTEEGPSGNTKHDAVRREGIRTNSYMYFHPIYSVSQIQNEYEEINNRTLPSGSRFRE